MGARDDDDQQMPIFAPLSANELSPLSRSRRISDQFQHMQFSPTSSASAEVLQVQEARMPILRTVDGTPLQLQPTLRSSLGSRGRRRRRGRSDGERRKPDGDEATDGTHSETCSPDSSENSTSSLDHRSGGSIPASLIFTCQPPSPASTMMCKSLGPSGGPTVLLSTAPPGVGPVGRACLPDLILSQLSEETEACDYDDDNDCLDASIAGSITLEHLETDDAIERAIQLRMATGPHRATDGPGCRPGAGGEDSGNSRSCFRLNNKDQSHGNNNKSLRFLDQVSDRSLITHEHTIPRVTSVDVEALYYSETDLANFREEYAVEKALERAAGQFCMSQERMSGPKRRGSGPRRPRNVGPVDSDSDSRPAMPSRDDPELNGGRRSRGDSPPRPRSRGMTRQSGMRNLGLRGSIRVLSAADLADSSSDDDDDDDSTDSDDRPSKSDEEEKANQIDISKLRGRPGRLDFPLSVPLSVRTRAQVDDD